MSNVTIYLMFSIIYIFSPETAIGPDVRLYNLFKLHLCVINYGMFAGVIVPYTQIHRLIVKIYHKQERTTSV